MNAVFKRSSVALATLIAVFSFLGPAPRSFAAEFGSGSAAAQAKAPLNENPLIAKGTAIPNRVGVGGTAEFVISLDLADDYHAYLDRFKITVLEPEELKLAEYRVTPTIDFMDTVSKKMKKGVHGHAELRALFEVPEDFKQGPHTAKINLGYQACTADHCLFPKIISLEIPFEVTSGMEAAGGGDSSSHANATLAQPVNEFEKALSRGIIPALAFVFVVGFLTSLTPCVYPMIPITLAILGARNKGHSKLRSLSLSIVYVLGIALTYSALGVIAASTGALFGAALSNVYIVTALALVFVAMGLSMYGLFEIQAPAFIRRRIGAAKSDAGFTSAFGMGLVAGVVASPCIGPVLVSVLTYIARTQDKFLGFIFLFTFALGMGLLFIGLGVSSSLLHRLPKAGPWMDGVKYLFGTVMIGMAIYYVAPVYPAWLFRIALGAALILVASLLGAFEPNQHLSVAGKIRKGLMLAAMFTGAAFAAAGTLERSGVQLGASVMNAVSGESFPKLAWQPFSDERLNAALKENKPVIIDFFAEWCGACKELERETFIDPRIRELSDRFTLLKIDATNDSPEIDRLKAAYQVMGLPTMIFYDLRGKIRNDLTVTGFEDADTFLNRMHSALGQREP